MGAHRRIAGVDQQETSCAVSVFQHARFQTALAEQRRLLIARDTRDGNGRAQQFGLRFAIVLGRRLNAGQQ